MPSVVVVVVVVVSKRMNGAVDVDSYCKNLMAQTNLKLTFIKQG